MKTSELRGKIKDDLVSLLEEKRKRCDALVQLLREKKTKNVKELRVVKKDIARLLTILKEHAQT